MKLVVGLLAFGLLAACVGPGDLAKNDPTLKLATKKDPRSYALCVFPKWQESRTDSTMAETESGYRLLVASNNMADEMLDIRKAPTGSSVTLRQRMAWSMMPGRSSIESAVKSCL